MRRDMDLVRQILLAIEAESFARSGGRVAVEGHAAQEMAYHVRLLNEAGLIRAVDVSPFNGPEDWIPLSLTWEGHEFLDACREPGRWEKAKAVIKEKAGAVGFEVLKALLVGLARESLGI